MRIQLKKVSRPRNAARGRVKQSHKGAIALYRENKTGSEINLGVLQPLHCSLSSKEAKENRCYSEKSGSKTADWCLSRTREHSSSVEQVV